MTTATWASRVRHDGDPAYQEWRDELITKLGLMVAAGVLAADETNITPAAGARAGTNAEQGYAVYHLADSLHGTAPIYIRLGFGTGSATSNPRLQVTVGTSTNGSGVLGGTALSTIASCLANASQATDTTRNSYLCVTAGFFGLSWKVGATCEASAFMARTVDSAGAISATGALLRLGAGNASIINKHQCFRYAATAAAYTATVTTADSMMGFFAGGQTSTLVGSDLQAAVAFTYTPRIQPIIGLMGALDTEIAVGTTFTCTPVGTTAHTYIGLRDTASYFGQTNGAYSPKICMLWE